VAAQLLCPAVLRAAGQKVVELELKLIFAKKTCSPNYLTKWLKVAAVKYCFREKIK
jgi:hypothetical protein